MKAEFDINAMFRGIEQNLREPLHQAVTEAFDLAFMEVQTKAKQLDTYTDQTGNLRSSIGYILFDDGKIFASKFSGSSDGSAKGESVANAEVEKIAGKYPHGIIGVIVAGMHYALYVEAKGYDVLTGPANELSGILEDKLKIVKEVFEE